MIISAPVGVCLSSWLCLPGDVRLSVIVGMPVRVCVCLSSWVWTVGVGLCVCDHKHACWGVCVHIMLVILV